MIAIATPAAVSNTPLVHVSSIDAFGVLENEKTIVMQSDPVMETGMEYVIQAKDRFVMTHTNARAHEMVFTLPMKWDKAAGGRFHELVVKDAKGRLTKQEQHELKKLQDLRMDSTPGMTYEEFIAEGERAQRTEEFMEAFQRYVEVCQG